MLDVEKIRKDFPMLSYRDSSGRQLIYFDNGATTFKPQPVIDAENFYYTNINSNIHRGDYELSFRADSAYDEVRKKVAGFINCRPEEVIFTSGTTDSLNMAAYGLKHMLQPGDVILLSLHEHASNSLPWFRIARKTGARVEMIPLDESGRITADNVRKVMTDRVRIVSLAQVTNVMGYEAPIREIAQLAHEKGALMIVDGAQSVPHMKVDVQQLGCDFLAFSGHKMCAPTGSGVLFGRYELLKELEPVRMGGGANARFNSRGEVILSDIPQRFEAGTPAIAQVIGLGAAIDYLSALRMDEIREREKHLHAYLVNKVKDMDNLIIYNPDAEGAIMAFNVRDVFAQDAATYLNSKSIAVRSGNHCAKMLVEHLGTDATIRCSLYYYNTEEEIDYFADVLKTCTVANCIGVFF
ncbi:MAG: cysteine desulfurase [Erysipelotrichaceae bacterium]|nr:cysteine desulfurase [Erysipelotrichaceae bacterium]